MATLLAQVGAAPHRSYFAAGGAALLAASLAWAALLLAPIATAVPAQAAHGVAYTLALFGPFVFGFLSTVFGISWSSLASHEIRLPRPAIGALRVISRGDGYNIDRLSEWQPRGEVQGGEIPSTIS